MQHTKKKLFFPFFQPSTGTLFFSYFIHRSRVQGEQECEQAEPMSEQANIPPLGKIMLYFTAYKFYKNQFIFMEKRKK